MIFNFFQLFFQFSDVVSFWLPTQVRDLALNDDKDFRTYLNSF